MEGYSVATSAAVFEKREETKVMTCLDSCSDWSPKWPRVYGSFSEDLGYTSFDVLCMSSSVCPDLNSCLDF